MRNDPPRQRMRGSGEGGWETRPARWPRRLNLVLFLAVVFGLVWLVGEVRQRGGRIEVRAEYLDQSTSVGLASLVFSERVSGDPVPWVLGTRTALKVREGETWKLAIERTFPECKVLSVAPIRVDEHAALAGAVMELATIVLQVDARPPQVFLAVAVGLESALANGGLPALLLTSEEPPSHEYAVRGVTWTVIPRSWFGALVGRPKFQCVISTYRGERSIEEVLRFADGPPWGREILERAFSTER